MVASQACGLRSRAYIKRHHGQNPPLPFVAGLSPRAASRARKGESGGAGEWEGEARAKAWARKGSLGLAEVRCLLVENYSMLVRFDRQNHSCNFTWGFGPRLISHTLGRDAAILLAPRPLAPVPDPHPTPPTPPCRSPPTRRRPLPLRLPPTLHCPARPPPPFPPRLAQSPRDNACTGSLLQ